MTKELHDYLADLGESGREKTRRDSERALRTAWPRRNDLRAKVVIGSNITMLRNLRAL